MIRLASFHWVAQTRLAKALLGPQRLVTLTALLALMASTYPVIFAGRSFVTPSNGGTVMLYRPPAYLPDLPVEDPEDTRGADVGAMMLYSVPTSFIEHRAIFRDHELPLWNRYSAAGRPVIGQGMSMLGDPLHWIPILSGGASWAWDIKFVLAKFLFIWGIGLTVLAATGFLPSALVMTVTAAFIGLTVARVNHPAIFSVCYAPWVFLPMLRLCDTASRPRRLGWGLVLAVAGTALIDSGLVKESYLMLVTMGGAGFLVCLLTALPRGQKALLCGGLVLFGAGLVGMTFVFWGTFLDALSRAGTLSDNPTVGVLNPGYVLTLFDNVFVAKMMGLPLGLVGWIIPSNIIVLMGIAWAVVRFDVSRKNPVFLALGALSLVLMASMFHVIPPEVLVRVPFVNRVIHVHQTFSHLLIPPLLILGGFGVRALWLSSGHRSRWPYVLYVLLILLVFAGFYAQLDRDGTKHKEALISWPTFLLVFSVAAPYTLQTAIRKKKWDRCTWGLLVGGSALAIGVNGMHLETGLGRVDYFLLNPKHRANFFAESPALNQIKARMTEPARVVGPDYDFFPGFQSMVDMEGIGGAEALMNPRYGEFLLHMGLQKTDWGWLDLLSSDVVRQNGSVFDMLNVRYLVHARPPATNICPNGKPIIEADLLVCERSTAWPRAFFTNRIYEYQIVEELRAIADRAPGQPFAALQASDLEAKDVRQGLPQVKQGESIAARDYALTNNSTSFTVTARGPGIAVLQEADERGQFTVTVNGLPSRYIRVNHAFKGIPIPQGGEYRIVVTYRPLIARWYSPTLGIGAAVLLAAILAMAWVQIEPKN